MELGEVVNPHYAFPVVGVILCVLLVFAFGFKSPAQPPSFDGLEEEKRNIPKKRSKSTKSKENKTKTQQNGRVGGSPTTKQLPGSKPPTNAVTSGVVTDKQNSKIESKSKKARSAANPPRQKLEQTDLPRSKTVTNPEDNLEGEWVQQLSKKERKHRRKEEVANACVIIETDKSSDNGNWDEHQNIAELSSGSQVSTPLKGSPKQDSKSKCNGIQQLNQDAEVHKNQKKKPKKENVSHADVSNLPTKYEALQKENNEMETEQYNEIPNTSIEIYNEIVEENSGAEEKSKRKKSKKKVQDANPSSGKSSSNEDFTSKKSLLIEETIESKKSSFTIVKNNVSEIGAPEDTADINELQNSKAKHDDVKNDGLTLTESGSNVVFDELADMWQDAKSQKKKKKARREQ